MRHFSLWWKRNRKPPHWSHQGGNLSFKHYLHCITLNTLFIYDEFQFCLVCSGFFSICGGNFFRVNSFMTQICCLYLYILLLVLLTVAWEPMFSFAVSSNTCCGIVFLYIWPHAKITRVFLGFLFNRSLCVALCWSFTPQAFCLVLKELCIECGFCFCLCCKDQHPNQKS